MRAKRLIRTNGTSIRAYSADLKEYYDNPRNIKIS